MFLVTYRLPLIEIHIAWRFPNQIARQREGKPFDGALVKNVLGMFAQLGIKSIFVEEMLKETADYYCDKASSLILEHSYHEYMLKVNYS